MPVTIRRNKYGRLAYATKLDNPAAAAPLVTGWSPDPAAAVTFEDAIAKRVVDAFEARHGGVKGCTAGQLIVVDAKGKVVATAGDPGEAPKPAPVVTTLPGLAEEVKALRERVELIEASGDAGGAGGEEVKRLAKAVAEIDKAVLEHLDARPQFTATEYAAIKAMLAKPVLEPATVDPKAKTDPSKGPVKPDATKAPAG